MKLAMMEFVIKKEMSIRKAAASFNASKDCLQRRVKGTIKNLPTEKLHKNILGRYSSILSEQEEKDLTNYIIQLDEAFYGLSIMEIGRVCRKKKVLVIPSTKQTKWPVVTL